MKAVSTELSDLTKLRVVTDDYDLKEDYDLENARVTLVEQAGALESKCVEFTNGRRHRAFRMFWSQSTSDEYEREHDEIHRWTMEVQAMLGMQNSLGTKGRDPFHQGLSDNAGKNLLTEGNQLKPGEIFKTLAMIQSYRLPFHKTDDSNHSPKYCQLLLDKTKLYIDSGIFCIYILLDSDYCHINSYLTDQNGVSKDKLDEILTHLRKLKKWVEDENKLPRLNEFDNYVFKRDYDKEFYYYTVEHWDHEQESQPRPHYRR